MNARSLAVLLFLVVGCSSAAGPSPSSTNTPTPSPGPTPSASDVIVLPDEQPVEARVAIPGEKVCFLIVFNDRAQGATWTARAEGATILSGGKTGNVVDELCVAPDPTSVETTATVTVEVDLPGAAAPVTVTRTIQVWPEVDGRATGARPYFERWIAWLAENQPELGITADTEWQPSFVSTFLVVSHYAYWSDEWEMVIAWHNMIPPDDWTDVFLRRRGSDPLYTIAFRQDSVAGNSEPHAAQLPETLIR